MNWTIPKLSGAIAVIAVSASVAACSLLSGDIKESNELGEWVVAKPQTFRYKTYPLGRTETIQGLTDIVNKKHKYYKECLQGKVRSGYKKIYGSGADYDFEPIEYTENCSKDFVNREQVDISEDGDLTLSAAEKRLSTARALLRNNSAIKYAIKGVVWRGISKEIGKEEEKINNREYWCLNPTLSDSDKRQWMSFLVRLESSQENSSDPDTKMHERLHERICEVAWKTD
jgi:hypothetical protein